MLLILLVYFGSLVGRLASTDDDLIRSTKIRNDFTKTIFLKDHALMPAFSFNYLGIQNKAEMEYPMNLKKCHNVFDDSCRCPVSVCGLSCIITLYIYISCRKVKYLQKCPTTSSRLIQGLLAVN